jgi:hypothetical protein
MAEFPLIAFARECMIGACLARHDRIEPRYQGRFCAKYWIGTRIPEADQLRFGLGKARKPNPMCNTAASLRGQR